jgi:hypothetical protein
VGHRGKLEEQERARVMRAAGATRQSIATELGVRRSSVSLWVRDVEFTPSLRRYGAQRRPHPAHAAKLREIEACNAEGVERIGTLSEEAFLVAGVALYAGEGTKGDGKVVFSRTQTRRWSRSSVGGCADSSMLTKVAYGYGSTSTKVSISTPQRDSGRA